MIKNLLPLILLGMSSSIISQENKIEPNGNVGIGTTSPQAKLSILSEDTPRGSSTDVLIGGDTPQIEFHDSNESGAIIYENSGLSLFTNGPTWNRNLFLKNNGNVGIGTTDTKGFKLGVKGKIAAEEVKVALFSGWSDFVFEESYNLPTIEEVENHIKEKGHLKDIPSAEEVAEKGIYLGEMDAKLLQKIEELTLYTIQQKKQLDKQSKEIDELKTIVQKLIESKK